MLLKAPGLEVLLAEDESMATLVSASDGPSLAISIRRRYFAAVLGINRPNPSQQKAPRAGLAGLSDAWVRE